jgi:DNA-binding response OmpR family regulator
MPSAVRSVMVVDDDHNVCDLLDTALTEVGYLARCVCDGEAAWAAVQEDRPDLIVSDIKMPRLDGVQLARRLDEADYRIPVILMSAGNDDKGGAARAFVRKPFDVGELLALIAVVMRDRENRHGIEPLAGTLDLAKNSR